MLERLISNLLNRYLGTFVNVDVEQLRVGVWSGRLHLNHLQIKSSLFASHRWPFALRRGTIGSFKLSLNWAKMSSVPVVIAIDDVFLLLTPKLRGRGRRKRKKDAQSTEQKDEQSDEKVSSDDDSEHQEEGEEGDDADDDDEDVEDASTWSRERIDAYLQEKKRWLLEQAFETARESFLGTAQQPSNLSLFAASFMASIVDNIQFQVQRVHICVDAPGSCYEIAMTEECESQPSVPQSEEATPDGSPLLSTPNSISSPSLTSSMIVRRPSRYPSVLPRHSYGFLLDSLSVETTDAAGQATFVKSDGAIVYKRVEMDGLAAYWDAHLPPALSSSEVKDASMDNSSNHDEMDDYLDDAEFDAFMSRPFSSPLFHQSIENSNTPSTSPVSARLFPFTTADDFILLPSHVSLQLEMSKHSSSRSPETAKHASVKATLSISRVPLSLSSVQLSSMAQVLPWISAAIARGDTDRLLRHAPHVAPLHRPHGPSSSRLWWRYAIGVHVHRIQSKHEERRWLNIVRARRDFFAYNILYRSKLLALREGKNEDIYALDQREEIEMRWPIETLLVWRRLVEQQTRLTEAFSQLRAKNRAAESSVSSASASAASPLPGVVSGNSPPLSASSSVSSLGNLVSANKPLGATVLGWVGGLFYAPKPPSSADYFPSSSSTSMPSAPLVLEEHEREQLTEILGYDPYAPLDSLLRFQTDEKLLYHVSLCVEEISLALHRPDSLQQPSTSAAVAASSSTGFSLPALDLDAPALQRRSSSSRQDLVSISISSLSVLAEVHAAEHRVQLGVGGLRVIDCSQPQGSLFSCLLTSASDAARVLAFDKQDQGDIPSSSSSSLPSQAEQLMRITYYHINRESSSSSSSSHSPSSSSIAPPTIVQSDSVDLQISTMHINWNNCTIAHLLSFFSEALAKPVRPERQRSFPASSITIEALRSPSTSPLLPARLSPSSSSFPSRAASSKAAANRLMPSAADPRMLLNVLKRKLNATAPERRGVSPETSPEGVRRSSASSSMGHSPSSKRNLSRDLRLNARRQRLDAEQQSSSSSASFTAPPPPPSSSASASPASRSLARFTIKTSMQSFSISMNDTTDQCTLAHAEIMAVNVSLERLHSIARSSSEHDSSSSSADSSLAHSPSTQIKGTVGDITVYDVLTSVAPFASGGSSLEQPFNRAFFPQTSHLPPSSFFFSAPQQQLKRRNAVRVFWKRKKDDACLLTFAMSMHSPGIEMAMGSQSSSSSAATTTSRSASLQRGCDSSLDVRLSGVSAVISHRFCAVILRFASENFVKKAAGAATERAKLAMSSLKQDLANRSYLTKFAVSVDNPLIFFPHSSSYAPEQTATPSSSDSSPAQSPDARARMQDASFFEQPTEYLVLDLGRISLLNDFYLTDSRHELCSRISPSSSSATTSTMSVVPMENLRISIAAVNLIRAVAQEASTSSFSMPRSSLDDLRAHGRFSETQPSSTTLQEQSQTLHCMSDAGHFWRAAFRKKIFEDMDITLTSLSPAAGLQFVGVHKNDVKAVVSSVHINLSDQLYAFLLSFFLSDVQPFMRLFASARSQNVEESVDLSEGAKEQSIERPHSLAPRLSPALDAILEGDETSAAASSSSSPSTSASHSRASSSSASASSSSASAAATLAPMPIPLPMHHEPSFNLVLSLREVLLDLQMTPQHTIDTDSSDDQEGEFEGLQTPTRSSSHRSLENLPIPASHTSSSLPPSNSSTSFSSSQIVSREPQPFAKIQAHTFVFAVRGLMESRTPSSSFECSVARLSVQNTRASCAHPLYRNIVGGHKDDQSRLARERRRATGSTASFSTSSAASSGFMDSLSSSSSSSLSSSATSSVYSRLAGSLSSSSSLASSSFLYNPVVEDTLSGGTLLSEPNLASAAPRSPLPSLSSAASAPLHHSSPSISSTLPLSLPLPLPVPMSLSQQHTMMVLPPTVLPDLFVSGAQENQLLRLVIDFSSPRLVISSECIHALAYAAATLSGITSSILPVAAVNPAASVHIESALSDSGREESASKTSARTTEESALPAEKEKSPSVELELRIRDPQVWLMADADLSSSTPSASMPSVTTLSTSGTSSLDLDPQHPSSTAGSSSPSSELRSSPEPILGTPVLHPAIRASIRRRLNLPARPRASSPSGDTDSDDEPSGVSRSTNELPNQAAASSPPSARPAIAASTSQSQQIPLLMSHNGAKSLSCLVLTCDLTISVKIAGSDLKISLGFDQLQALICYRAQHLRLKRLILPPVALFEPLNINIEYESVVDNDPDGAVRFSLSSAPASIVTAPQAATAFSGPSSSNTAASAAPPSSFARINLPVERASIQITAIDACFSFLQISTAASILSSLHCAIPPPWLMSSAALAAASAVPVDPFSTATLQAQVPKDFVSFRGSLSILTAANELAIVNDAPGYYVPLLRFSSKPTSFFFVAGVVPLMIVPLPLLLRSQGRGSSTRSVVPKAPQSNNRRASSSFTWPFASSTAAASSSATLHSSGHNNNAAPLDHRVAQDTTLFMSTTVSGLYYNSDIGQWESFIDPWSLSVDGSSDRIMLSSSDLFSVHVSPTCIATLARGLDSFNDHFMPTIQGLGEYKPAHEKTKPQDRRATPLKTSSSASPSSSSRHTSVHQTAGMAARVDKLAHKASYFLVRNETGTRIRYWSVDASSSLSIIDSSTASLGVGFGPAPAIVTLGPGEERAVELRQYIGIDAVGSGRTWLHRSPALAMAVEDGLYSERWNTWQHIAAIPLADADASSARRKAKAFAPSLLKSLNDDSLSSLEADSSIVGLTVHRLNPQSAPSQPRGDALESTPSTWLACRLAAAPDTEGSIARVLVVSSPLLLVNRLFVDLDVRLLDTVLSKVVFDGSLHSGQTLALPLLNLSPRRVRLLVRPVEHVAGSRWRWSTNGPRLHFLRLSTYRQSMLRCESSPRADRKHSKQHVDSDIDVGSTPHHSSSGSSPSSSRFFFARINVFRSNPSRLPLPEMDEEKADENTAASKLGAHLQRLEVDHAIEEDDGLYTVAFDPPLSFKNMLGVSLDYRVEMRDTSSMPSSAPTLLSTGELPHRQEVHWYNMDLTLTARHAVFLSLRMTAASASLPVEDHHADLEMQPLSAASSFSSSSQRSTSTSESLPLSSVSSSALSVAMLGELRFLTAHELELVHSQHSSNWSDGWTQPVLIHAPTNNNIELTTKDAKPLARSVILRDRQERCLYAALDSSESAISTPSSLPTAFYSSRVFPFAGAGPGLVTAFVSHWLFNLTGLPLLFGTVVKASMYDEETVTMCAGQASDEEILRQREAISRREDLVGDDASTSPWYKFASSRRGEASSVGLEILCGVDGAESTDSLSEGGTDGWTAEMRAKPFRSEPFLLSFEESDSADRHKKDASHLACVRLPHTDWGKPFSVDAVGTHGAIELEEEPRDLVSGQAQRPSRLYEFGVSVILHPNPRFHRTKAVLLHPRYILHNATERLLQIRQIGTRHTLLLPPLSQRSFHRTDASLDARLCLRLQPHAHEAPWLWSASRYGIAINQVGQQSLRARNQGQQQLLVRVQVVLRQATFEIKFRISRTASSKEGAVDNNSHASERKKKRSLLLSSSSLVPSSSFSSDSSSPTSPQRWLGRSRTVASAEEAARRQQHSSQPSWGGSFDESSPPLPLHSTTPGSDSPHHSRHRMSRSISTFASFGRERDMTRSLSQAPLSATLTSSSSASSSSLLPVSQLSLLASQLQADDAVSPTSTFDRQDEASDADGSSFAPYRIENHSLHTLVFHQFEEEGLSEELPPYRSMIYAWDEPMGTKELVLSMIDARSLQKQKEEEEQRYSQRDRTTTRARLKSYAIGRFSLNTIATYPPVSVSNNADREANSLLDSVRVSVFADGRVLVLRVEGANSAAVALPAAKAAAKVHTFRVKLAGVNVSVVTHAMASSAFANVRLKRSAEGVFHVFDASSSRFSNAVYTASDSRISMPVARQELLNLLIKNIDSTLTHGDDRLGLRLSIQHCQLDCQLQSAEFPVVLSTAAASDAATNLFSSASSSSSSAASLESNALTQPLDAHSFFALSLVKSLDKSRDDLLFLPYLAVRMAKMELRIEEQLVSHLLHFTHLLSPIFDEDRTNNDALSSSATRARQNVTSKVHHRHGALFEDADLVVTSAQQHHAKKQVAGSSSSFAAARGIRTTPSTPFSSFRNVALDSTLQLSGSVRRRTTMLNAARTHTNVLASASADYDEEQDELEPTSADRRSLRPLESIAIAPSKSEGAFVDPDADLFMPAPLILYLQQLVIHPMQVNVSYSSGSRSGTSHVSARDHPVKFILRALNVTLLNIDSAPLRLSSLHLKDVFASQEDLLEKIRWHYVFQLSSGFYSLLGSSDLLGNPVGLFTSISSGLESFFYEPALGLVHSPAAFTSGIAKGTISLVQHSLYGLTNTTRGILSSLSKGLASLTQHEVDNSSHSLSIQAHLRRSRSTQLGSSHHLSVLSRAQATGLTMVSHSLRSTLGLVGGAVDLFSSAAAAISQAVNPQAVAHRIRVPILYEFGWMPSKLSVELQSFVSVYLRTRPTQLFYCSVIPSQLQANSRSLTLILTTTHLLVVHTGTASRPTPAVLMHEIAFVDLLSIRQHDEQSCIVSFETLLPSSNRPTVQHVTLQVNLPRHLLKLLSKLIATRTDRVASL